MQSFIPIMTPAPGERLLRFVGDRLRFLIKDRNGRSPEKNWRAMLRTDIGRAEVLRNEIIQACAKGSPPGGASWRDLPMKAEADGWSIEVPLAEVAFCKAKAYLVDPKGWQHWPEGPDVGISIHPNAYRTGNTIYCAFTRLFGRTKTAFVARDEKLENTLRIPDAEHYTVIPPSGTLRNLIQHLPHIIETLGCRIVHLLPVNPTPTTYARFGRFGSPYAALDLTAIDPALVEFDRRTTGIDQFRELTYAVRCCGGRVFIDIVINHTGWGSRLQEDHPEWFLRNPDGTFTSPGAWGTTWEDLVELKHTKVALWDELAEMFLTWCRRGVDGFRCDAGYKVPVNAWQYIVARVQQEFPETIFLLEGLGGAWEATEALLTEGGMQWAYSELFQNYSPVQISGYLDHGLKQSQRVGLLVHYSETHDNERLAAKPLATQPVAVPASGASTREPNRVWSLLRNRLCALTSVSGGFGFTCGVEWLATEKIRVHGSTGLAWGSKENIVPELARLNGLLAEHPCFFDAAKLTRLSAIESPVYALLRESAEGKDRVLVLVNTDPARESTFLLNQPELLACDLLGQSLPKTKSSKAGEVSILLPAGAAYCLSPTPGPQGLSGNAYRRARAQAAWAVQTVTACLPLREIGEYDWRILAKVVARSPLRLLGAIRYLDNARADLVAALEDALAKDRFPQVIRWQRVDHQRVTVVPPDHWLLLEDKVPFRATLQAANSKNSHVQSIEVADGHIACFLPQRAAVDSVTQGFSGRWIPDAKLVLERYTEKDQHIEATIRYLAPGPQNLQSTIDKPQSDALVLLTNGIGGMTRICVDLGRVKSKYDCVLGASLHPTLPVDRHILAKRIRIWVNADGFISPLNQENLASFNPGPPAVWRFVANAGDGRTAQIEIRADMLEGRNATVFHFSRPDGSAIAGKELPPDADVRLTVRLDIEDRNFHGETKRNAGADHHFSSNTKSLSDKVGFQFAPAADRQLKVFVAEEATFPPLGTVGVHGVFANRPSYQAQPEWSENIPHPIEQSRGQVGSGDAFSPGWFDLPLPKGGSTTIVVTADTADLAKDEIESSKHRMRTPRSTSAFPETDAFGQQLLRAARAFVVRRGEGKTVIAGYPWFLDWGRDTFICARGLLAAGMIDEVRQILLTFARFEKDGTLPNTIFGEDASNRDTSDAPLWFALVAEELACHTQSGKRFYSTQIDSSGRTIADVLWSIAVHYAKSTPNGIRMDADSGLIWSPSHFTWMDTNYPAGSAREGYPVEIQALWIRLLRQLEHIGGRAERAGWDQLSIKAIDSFEKLFWLEEQGFYADVLLAKPGEPAARAAASDALRSNCLFAISLGLVASERAKRCVDAAARYLVVPGGLRSLAPLPVKVPLPVQGNNGRLLNDPHRPYWGRYEGDEDTRRKPAYHNGTAWTWTFPTFCEALAQAWDFSPEAVAAAKAYLGSVDRLMNEGCLGHIPEILDGDAPHTQRGCDAQAWGVTETLRVWKLLGESGSSKDKDQSSRET